MKSANTYLYSPKERSTDLLGMICCLSLTYISSVLSQENLVFMHCFSNIFPCLCNGLQHHSVLFEYFPYLLMLLHLCDSGTLNFHSSSLHLLLPGWDAVTCTETYLLIDIEECWQTGETLHLGWSGKHFHAGSFDRTEDVGIRSCSPGIIGQTFTQLEVSTCINGVLSPRCRVRLC